ncbi:MULTISPECIES: hypothetical protein [unclassified Adlercreutzia]|uniref:hypothetical protein n=1 Tax=unclassified Adlercreutzia TaxID=2636013 RepID=UPI0013EB9BD5|nr:MULTISPECIES: hypothetical protein [unclassified Adlercreutzia]
MESMLKEQAKPQVGMKKHKGIWIMRAARFGRPILWPLAATHATALAATSTAMRAANARGNARGNGRLGERRKEEHAW